MKQLKAKVPSMLIITLEIVVMALYGWIQFQTFQAAIVFVLLEVAFLFIGKAMGVSLVKLDKHQIREKVPLAIRYFLRRNPEIRSQIAISTMRVLVSILLTQQIIGLLFNNHVVSAVALIVLLLLGVVIYLLSTLFPDNSGKVIRFDDVKLLLFNADFKDAHDHFEKAVNFYDDILDRDVHNCVKEAACALEAYVFKRTGEKKFGAGIRELTGKGAENIVDILVPGLEMVYGYRNRAKGVAHAAIEGSKITPAEAQLILNLTASYLVYLEDLVSLKTDSLPTSTI